ncbi:MAG: DNA polymerase III subunit delta [Spirulina sp. SIO3F2]|nr:DNA polymerase III subunit delta [Spirulina sp. SIO3F2]
MPIYLFWGEDEFAMSQAIARLRKACLDPAWVQFNDQKIIANQTEAILEGLAQAMTPPFGTGGRFVWLAETTVCQTCPEAVLTELQRTLPQVPEHCTLLLSCPKKPDGRAKSTKLLQKQAQIREFSPIPPWKTDQLLRQVQDHAADQGVKLTPKAAVLLAESVGNNTRQLWNELAKLRLYNPQNSAPLDEQTVARLVVVNTQSSLKLAAAIRDGQSDRAVGLVAELLNRNEPALRIVATLVGQFRTWAMIKVMLEGGERDEKAIAKAADIGNPKRLYFLKKELQGLRGQQLLQTLPILLALEVSLKRGGQPLATLQTKVVELCEVCRGYRKV